MGANNPGDAVKQLLRLVDRMPLVGGLKRDVVSLQRTVYERRAPRLLAIGPEGVGKSSLVDALLGQPILRGEGALEEGRWIRIDAEGRRIEWLELRPEAVDAPRAFRAGLDEMVPDVILLVATPEVVEGGMGRLVEGLRAMLAQLTEVDGAPKMLPVLMERGEISGDEVESRVKADLIQQKMRRALRDAGVSVEPVQVIGSVVPLPSRAPDAPIPRGLENLSERINALLPESALIEAARALAHAHEGRRHVANEVIHSCAALGITVSVTPVPFADAALLLPLQLLMVTTIAYLSGRAWDTKGALEWMASMGVAGGAGVGLRWGARQIFKLVPGAGSVVSAGVAGAGTAAIGHSAVAYFMNE